MIIRALSEYCLRQAHSSWATLACASGSVSVCSTVQAVSVEKALRWQREFHLWHPQSWKKMEEDPVAFLRINKLALLEENKSFDSKKWVWIQDKKECFKAAEVKSSKGDIYVVETNDGQVCLTFALFLSIKIQFYPDDLCTDHNSEKLPRVSSSYHCNLF